MSLSIGIVGLPNVGKSTLFNALTARTVPAENYPFCTIDPSTGLVPIPDERLENLSKMSKSAKTIPAVVSFTDIAGLVKGAAEGEGLGNKFLSHIREVDAIAHVVRVFEDDSVTHVHGAIDPLHDIDIINTELVLSDMEAVAKRKGKIEKEVKSGDKDAILENEILSKISDALEGGNPASSVSLSEKEIEKMKGFQLLTAKPMLYVLNKKPDTDLSDEKYKSLMQFLKEKNANFVEVDAGAKSFGVLASEAYSLLGLITFFTTGPDESRAWTIKENSAAPEAGAAIHSDFRDKFIRAEVVYYEDLMSAGSYGKAREKGKVRTEGKKYVVKDGDVIEFKI